MMRFRVLVISHSYIEPENQKSILALSRYVDLITLVPRKTDVLLFQDYEYVPQSGSEDVIRACRTWGISSACYVFLAMRLAPSEFRPDVILVEYNPWSMVFIQVWMYRALFVPKAKLMCLVKKTTYRRYKGLAGKLKDWVAEWSVSRVDSFIAASNMASHMLRRRFGQGVRILSVQHHLGVDTKLFCPRHEATRGPINAKTEVVVGYCGRLDEDKGVVELVEAVGLVRERTKANVVVSIVGRGSLNKMLSDMAVHEPWVRVRPPVPHVDVVSFLRSLDVFVLASKAMPDHEEHDAHALLEAMACGVSCIASTVGINSEIIKMGNGRLVASTDSYVLAGAIERLVLDPAERMKMGLKARKTALRKYSTETVAYRRWKALRHMLAS